MIVYENGSIYGTIGGGALEKTIINRALEAIKNNNAFIAEHNLVKDLAMCCGGTVSVFIEPVMNRRKLYIFGAGHVGKALACFATSLDFNITLIDDRYDAFENIEAQEYEVLNAHHSTAIAQLEFDEGTFVVILTYDHQHDREILALTSKKPHCYIGMIGSKRKVEIARKNMLAGNLMLPEELEQIDMPVGIDIKAVTPQEIAISILAKLILVRNSEIATKPL